MKTTLIQSDIIWHSPEANRKRLDGILPSGQDLIVLPEMFSTGFIVDPVAQAEKLPSPTLKWMKEKASDLNTAIAGSIAVEDETGHFYNRFCFVKPDGEVTTYDKHHLFTYGGEDKMFTPGKDRVIVEWQGIRFLLLICYDLRFPVWGRNRKDYDAIIIVASWPETRRKAWDTLLRARAIENQCYVLSVNRQGDDPSCHYSGGTYLIDPLGDVLFTAGDCISGEPFNMVSFDFNLEMLTTKYRPGFPVLQDADNFELI